MPLQKKSSIDDPIILNLGGLWFPNFLDLTVDLSLIKDDELNLPGVGVGTWMGPVDYGEDDP